MLVAAMLLVVALTEASLRPITPSVKLSLFGNGERVIVTCFDFYDLMISQTWNQSVLSSVFFISETKSSISVESRRICLQIGIDKDRMVKAP